MAKKKEKKQVFINGGNFADGSRFEIGEEVPSGLADSEIRALEDLGCIGDEEAAEGE